MARSIAQIKAPIIAQIQAIQKPDGSFAYTSPSSVAIFNTLAFIVAAAIAFFEQIHDLFLTNSEALIGTIPPATGTWWAYMIKQFQYGDILVLDVDPTSPTYLSSIYALINPVNQIITRVGVKRNIDGNIVIKVAQGTDTIIPLTAPQLAGLQAYANELTPLAVVECYSLNADLLATTTTFYIDGQYSDTISDDIIVAINNYLATISSVDNFDGTFSVIDFEVAMRAVNGVNDLVVNSLNIRADGATFPTGGVSLVDANTLIQRNYVSVAGYINYDSSNSTLTLITV